MNTAENLFDSLLERSARFMKTAEIEIKGNRMAYGQAAIVVRIEDCERYKQELRKIEKERQEVPKKKTKEMKSVMGEQNNFTFLLGEAR